MRRYRVSLLILVLLTISCFRLAEGQVMDPCEDWRQGASETMSRVAGAQSRTEEALGILLGLIKQLNAGEKDAQQAFDRERKRAERTVEESVTASRLAAEEASLLVKRLQKMEIQCPEAEHQGMKWASWWFDNHGQIVMMRAAYLAAARLDFPRAQSIFGEIIALAGKSENPNYAGMLDRASRGLAMVKMEKVPFIPRERKYQKQHNPGKVPPLSTFRNQREGGREARNMALGCSFFSYAASFVVGARSGSFHRYGGVNPDLTVRRVGLYPVGDRRQEGVLGIGPGEGSPCVLWGQLVTVLPEGVALHRAPLPGIQGKRI